MTKTVDRFPGVPPQLREILDSHPELAGMKEALPGFQPERRTVTPPDPAVPAESPFVLLYLYTEDPFGEYEWTNKPKDAWLSTDVGHGLGFGAITEKPVIKEPGKRPKRRPDLFDFIGWHVASRKFVEVIERFDPGVVTTQPIEWKFGGASTEDFVFFDINRLVDAYDYRRSVLDVDFAHGRRNLHDLNFPRALKPGAGNGQHIFRDYYRRHEILVSRELATALVKSGMRGIRFNDLATGRTLELSHAEYGELYRRYWWRFPGPLFELALDWFRKKP